MARVNDVLLKPLAKKLLRSYFNQMIQMLPKAVELEVNTLLEEKMAKLKQGEKELTLDFSSEMRDQYIKTQKLQFLMQ